MDDHRKTKKQLIDELVQTRERVTRLEHTEAELEEAREALRVSQARQLRAERIAHVGNWEGSVISDEVFYSDEACRIYGLNSDENNQKNDYFFNNIVHPDDRDIVLKAEQDALLGKKYCIDHRIVLPNGEVRIVHEDGEVGFDDSGKPVSIAGTVQDITERKQTEKERQANFKFFKSMDQINRMMQGTNDLEQVMRDVLDEVLSTLECDRAFLAYPCNPESAVFQIIMPRTKSEYPTEVKPGDKIPMAEGDREMHRRMLVSGVAKYDPSTPSVCIKKNAELYDVKSMMGMQLYIKTGTPWAFGVHQCSHERIWTANEERLFQEIGRRLGDVLTSLLIHRNLKESENKYRELANSITDVFFAMDTDLRYTYWNEALEDLTGIKAEDALGKTIFDIFPDTNETRKEITVYQEVFKTKLPKSFENEYRFKDKHYFFEINAYLHEDEEGISVFAKDITERKQAEDQLKLALADKEILLQELYHRTKNNMQVIIGLIDLQVAQSQDKAAKVVLQETKNRVYSMALVHKKLYQSQNLSSIDFAEYILELTTLLMKSYQITPDRVSLVLELDSVPILIDTAVPCGLILNELITNVFKHAFPPNKQGELRIVLKQLVKDEIMLQISDDGVGLPSGFNPIESDSVGLHTVFGIAEYQLQGKITCETAARGVTWLLHFSNTLYQPRV